MDLRYNTMRYNGELTTFVKFEKADNRPTIFGKTSEGKIMVFKLKGGDDLFKNFGGLVFDFHLDAWIDAGQGGLVRMERVKSSSLKGCFDFSR